MQPHEQFVGVAAPDLIDFCVFRSWVSVTFEFMCTLQFDS
jgi:hypothetical protein